MKEFLKPIPKGVYLHKEMVLDKNLKFSAEWKSEEKLFNWLRDSFLHTNLIHIGNYTPNASFIVKDDLNTLKMLSDIHDDFEKIRYGFADSLNMDSSKRLVYDKETKDASKDFEKRAHEEVSETREKILEIKNQFSQKLEEHLDGIVIYKPSFWEKLFDKD